jgi:hypothetical protein
VGGRTALNPGGLSKFESAVLLVLVALALMRTLWPGKPHRVRHQNGSRRRLPRPDLVQHLNIASTVDAVVVAGHDPGVLLFGVGEQCRARFVPSVEDVCSFNCDPHEQRDQCGDTDDGRARQNTAAAMWNNPVYVRTNVRITATWAVAFTFKPFWPGS